MITPAYIAGLILFVSETSIIPSLYRMKSLHLVVVVAFTFSLLQVGASQCDGEKICV